MRSWYGFGLAFRLMRTLCGLTTVLHDICTGQAAKEGHRQVFARISVDGREAHPTTLMEITSRW